MAQWDKFSSGLSKGLSTGYQFGGQLQEGRKNKKLRKTGKAIADYKDTTRGEVEFLPAEQEAVPAALPVAVGNEGGVAAPPVASGSAPPVSTAPPPAALPTSGLPTGGPPSPPGGAPTPGGPPSAPGPMQGIQPEPAGASGSFKLPTTKDIYALREEMADVYLRAGDIEGFTKAQDSIDKYLHQQFMTNSKQAQTLLQQGDVQAAGKALKRAYSFFPNGSEIDLQMKDGKLIGVGYEAGEGGAPGQFKGAMVVTPEAIDRMTRNFNDPEAYARWDVTSRDLMNKISQQDRAQTHKEETTDWEQEFRTDSRGFNQKVKGIEMELKNNADIINSQNSSSRRKYMEQLTELTKAQATKALAQAESELSGVGGAGMTKAEQRQRTGAVSDYFTDNRTKYIVSSDPEFTVSAEEAQKVLGTDVWQMYQNDPTALAKNNAMSIKLAAGIPGTFNPPEVLNVVENAQMAASKNGMEIQLAYTPEGYKFAFRPEGSGPQGQVTMKSWEEFRQGNESFTPDAAAIPAGPPAMPPAPGAPPAMPGAALPVQ